MLFGGGALTLLSHLSMKVCNFGPLLKAKSGKAKSQIWPSTAVAMAVSLGTKCSQRNWSHTCACSSQTHFKRSSGSRKERSRCLCATMSSSAPKVTSSHTAKASGAAVPAETLVTYWNRKVSPIRSQIVSPLLTSAFR